MVEMEQRLQEWGERLPIIVNDCSLCPGGTTEELCCYFASIPLESHVKLTHTPQYQYHWVRYKSHPVRLSPLLCRN